MGSAPPRRVWRARCPHCRERFQWENDPSADEARCPTDGRLLRQVAYFRSGIAGGLRPEHQLRLIKGAA